MSVGRVVLIAAAWLGLDLLIVGLFVLRAWRLRRFKKEAR